MNSKQKGNAGERELARILREYGYDTRRGLQYQGGQIEADVVGLPGVHIECKRVQGLDLNKAMAQSIRDTKAGDIPVVIHRENRKPWNVTIRARDFLRMGCRFPLEVCQEYGLVTMPLPVFMGVYMWRE